MGLPISMLCDRQTTKIPDAQIFFYNFFLEDLISTFIFRFPKLYSLRENGLENRSKWEELKNQPYYLKEDKFK
jgi:hypothetical protein